MTSEQKIYLERVSGEILSILEGLDPDERLEVFYTISDMYCMKCGEDVSYVHVCSFK